MARYIFQDVAKDGAGNVVTGATVSVFLAGVATAADVYEAESGGSTVNSVESDSTDGTFSFWVDASSYTANQKFKITITKTNYRPQTVDDIIIYPTSRQEFQTFTDGDTTPSIKGFENFKTGNTSATTISDFDNGYDGQVLHIIIKDTFTTIDFSGTNLKGNGGIDWKPTTNDHMSAVYDGTSWICSVVVSGAGLITFKSYSFTGRSAGTGTFYIAGYYDAPAADANLTNAGTTVTHGSANIAYGAQAFVVAAAAGVTDGSDLVLTVTGTSITDAGVRTATDSEVIVSDGTTSSTDEYFETTKKWIGQITYTLSSTGGTTFNYDFNYGFAKYEDFGNKDYVVTDFEVIGEAGANDSAFNIFIKHHESTGWTYHATAFVPGAEDIANMNTTYTTEVDLNSGDSFSYKLAGISHTIDGNDSEGIVIGVVVGANNSVQYLDAHVGVQLQS